MARKNTSAQATETATSTAVAPVAKFASVVILPPQRGLPQGHILISAIHGDTLAGTKQYQVNNEQELNTQLANTIKVSTEAGYALEIIIAARVHYRTTLRQFSRDPLSAVEYCREYTPQRQEQTQAQEGNDLPF